MTEWDLYPDSEILSLLRKPLAPVIESIRNRGVWTLEAPEKDWRDLDLSASLYHVYVLENLDQASALPPYSKEACEWAFAFCYEACRLMSFRDLGAEEIPRRLPAYSGNPADASESVSADLFLRYLPGILRVSEEHAEEDPLCKRLREEAKRWPLSCAGLALDWPADTVETLLRNPALGTLFLDRLHSCPDPILEDLPVLQHALKLRSPVQSFADFRSQYP